LVVENANSATMIRSIISNLPIGRAQGDAARVVAATTALPPVKLGQSVSFDYGNRGVGASYGPATEKRPSTCADSIALSEIYYDCDCTCTKAQSGVGSSATMEDEQEDSVFQVVIAENQDDESFISTVSFDALPDDPNVMDPITPYFSKDVYITYTRSDSDSYSLVLLEQQWFRLAKNSGFAAALYLQGITEVLHTVRGIFRIHPAESLYLVIDQGKKVYRLDRTNYRKGITACCSNALHTFLADQLWDGVY
jgi:hypothetical protein